MWWTWKGSDVTWRGVSTTLWRGEKLNEYTQALASERMPLAPQEMRTFFITAGTWGRRPIFRAEPMAQLFLDTLQRYGARKIGGNVCGVSVQLGFGEWEIDPTPPWLKP